MIKIYKEIKINKKTPDWAKSGVYGQNIGGYLKMFY